MGTGKLSTFRKSDNQGWDEPGWRISRTKWEKHARPGCPGTCLTGRHECLRHSKLGRTKFGEPVLGVVPENVPQEGMLPTSTINFGRDSISSARRVPTPVAG